jgi:mevalonate kinase
VLIMNGPIQAEACAKVIAYGEHFVLWGGLAVALPLPGVKLRLTLTEGAPGIDVLEAAKAEKLLGKAFRLFGKRKVPEDFHVECRSDFPPGEGLGGSAALCVALTRLVGRYLEVPEDEDDVVQGANELEKLFHGTPSGIDASTIGFQQPVYLQGASVFDDTEPEPRAGFLDIPEGLPLLVACTGVKGDTGAAVKMVRDTASTERGSKMLAAFTGTALNVALQGASALRSGAWREAGMLFNDNHVLLAGLGLSCTEVERLRLAALAAGAWGAKLTGGGIGGSVAVMAPPERLAAVRRALVAAGATLVLKP